MVEIFKFTGRVLAIFALLSPAAVASTADHTYKSGEHVELWVNKVNYLLYRSIVVIRVL